MNIRRWLSSAAAMLIYLAAAAIFLLPGLHGPGYILGNHTPDVLSFIWYMAWWPHAIGHGQNPMFTRAIWWPEGVNLFWTTSIPTAALLLSPVTVALGPIAAYNFAVLFAPVLLAWGTYELCRELHGRFWPAIFGGAVVGFSSYEFRQLLNHLHCCLIFPIPLLTLAAVRRFNLKFSRWIYIPLSALLWLLLFGISTEFFATAVMLGSVFVAVMILMESNPQTRRALLILAGESVTGLLSAVVAVLVIAGPYLWKGYAGGKLWSAGVYSVDPLNLIIPTYTTWLGSGLLAPLWHLFAGGRSDAEQGAYLGLPLIALAAAAWRNTRGPAMWNGLKITLVVALVLSLGPQLHALNQKLPLPLPWLIASHVPLIQKALPGRLMFYVDLMLAILISGWLARTNMPRGRKLAAALIAIFFLLPNTTSGYWSTHFSTPRVFARVPDDITPDPHGVLIFPFGYHGWSMLWQVQSHFAFSMVDGYTGIVPDDYSKSPLVRMWLSHGPLDTNYAAQLQAFLQHWHIRTVIAITPFNAREKQIIAPLGTPLLTLGRAEIFGHVPRWIRVEKLLKLRQSTTPNRR